MAIGASSRPVRALRATGRFFRHRRQHRRRQPRSQPLHAPELAGSADVPFAAAYEEALHVQFCLTLLDTYVTDPDERAEASAAVENIPSVQKRRNSA